MAKTNWEDKFNPLVQKILKIDNKDWKLTLEENKIKGTLQVNLREWSMQPLLMNMMDQLRMDLFLRLRIWKI